MKTLLAALVLMSSGVAACGAEDKKAAQDAAAQTNAAADPTKAQDGATGPQGPAGPQGPKGDTGAQGPAGAAGVKGSASTLGCYQQSTGEYLGIPVSGCAEIYFADGVSAWFGYQTGVASNTCNFTSDNCTGSCYVNPQLPKNTASFNGAKWFVVTGKEQPAQAMIASYIRQDIGVCTTISPSQLTMIELPTVWSPPVKLSVPLGPIYLGSAP